MMTDELSWRHAFLAFSAGLTLVSNHARADAFVNVRSSGFSPASVSINVGETVYFVVADDNAPYCIQSTTGAWTPWYLWEYGDGFGIQINERGDYHYRDIFTYNTGVIHVGTAVINVPPTVTILSPADGAVFTEPASFTFAANVSDADNGVLGAEFYVGTTLVEAIYSGDFSTQVTNLAAGNYSLSVVGYDLASAAVTNAVSITVQPATPPTIALTAPKIVAGQFIFAASGLTAGKRAVLQMTGELGPSANWVSLETNSVTVTTTSFATPILPGARFFRVVQLP